MYLTGTNFRPATKRAISSLCLFSYTSPYARVVTARQRMGREPGLAERTTEGVGFCGWWAGAGRIWRDNTLDFAWCLVCVVFVCEKCEGDLAKDRGKR